MINPRLSRQLRKEKGREKRLTLTVRIFICIEVICGALLFAALCYYDVYARVRSVDEFTKEEIVVKSYKFYPNRVGGEELFIQSQDGKKYYVIGNDSEYLKIKLVKEQIHPGDKLTIYHDDYDVNGMEDEKHVYLDVNLNVHEKVPLGSILFLAGLAVVELLLIYVCFALIFKLD